MQKINLFVLSLLFPAIVFAQEFRPLLDPTVACSYGSPDNFVDWETNKTKLVQYFIIVEKMPKSKAPLSEIENILKENVLFIERELNQEGKVVIQFLVNCEGKAGDFQIVHCPAEMANICCQIFNVLKNNLIEWEAGAQGKQNVDVLLKIVIEVNKGKLKIIGYQL